MKSIVALEIAGDFLRAAEIGNYTSAKPKLLRYAEEPLPRGIGGESEIFDVDIVSGHLKSLWKAGGFKTKHVALGIGGRRILVRPHEFAVRDLKKIRANLSYEVADILPSQMTDSILDFYPYAIEAKGGKGPELYRGLVVAAASGGIEKIIEACEAAKLFVDYVEFNAFALAKAARAAYGVEGEYLLVNSRQFSTDLVVMKNGAPRFVRNIATGIPASRRRGGGRRAAESAAPSFDESLAVETVNPMESLAAEIRSTVNFYAGQGGALANFVLVGEGAVSDDFRAILDRTVNLEQKVLGLDEVVGKPLKQKDRDESMEASLVSLLGVGMRGVK